MPEALGLRRLYAAFLPEYHPQSSADPYEINMNAHLS
jgi:hypothetical protein